MSRQMSGYGAGRRPGPWGFMRSAGQGLARTGKNLTWPGGRRSGPGWNRNAARRHRGRDRSFGNVSRLSGDISGSQRRTQRCRARNRRRSSFGVNLAGYRLGSLRYRFLFGSRGRVRRFSGGAGIGHMFRRAFFFFGARRSVRFPSQPPLDLNGDRFIDRAGVGFLFRDAQLGEHIEDHVRFHLELARQLVNSNFDHTVCPAVQFRHRGCQTKPCSLSRASAPAGTSAMSIVTDCPCGSSAVAAVSAGATCPSPPDSNCP